MTLSFACFLRGFDTGGKGVYKKWEVILLPLKTYAQKAHTSRKIRILQTPEAKVIKVIKRSCIGRGRQEQVREFTTVEIRENRNALSAVVVSMSGFYYECIGKIQQVELGW